MTEKRPYRMRERAKAQDETRRRIVEATMHLHEEIGPRATTISAIAERAGVQRLTVYRHFPDETAVFQACTSHWLELNPPPDPGGWAELVGWERLRAGVAAFYGYYSGTRAMWTAAHRDVAEVPALQGPMAEFAGLVGAVAVDLAGEVGGAGGVAVTLRHALVFPTWVDLEGQGIDDGGKVALVEGWVRGVIGTA
jgi:AcrR family transcriptional regulator